MFREPFSDPRVARIRAHKLIDIMVIGFCAPLAGGEGFNDMDFFGRQKKIAREIIDADADYVLALKGNHETVHAEVKSCLDVLKRDKSKCSMRLKGKKAGWNHDFLFDLLGIKAYGCKELFRCGDTFV